MDSLDPAQRVRQQLEADARGQFESDVRWLMASTQGRRLAWWLVDQLSCAFGGSFSKDPLDMAFNEGRRNVGLTVMRELQVLSPNDYLRMLGEEMDRRAGAVEAQKRAAAEALPE